MLIAALSAFVSSCTTSQKSLSLKQEVVYYLGTSQRMSLDGTTTGPTVRSLLKRDIDLRASQVNQLLTEPDRSEETTYPISNDDPKPETLALEMKVTDAVKSTAKYEKTTKEKYEETLAQIQAPTVSGSQNLRMNQMDDGSYSVPLNVENAKTNFIVDFAIGTTLVTPQFCSKVYAGPCPDLGKIRNSAHGEIQKTKLARIAELHLAASSKASHLNHASEIDGGVKLGVEEGFEAGVVDLSATTNAGIDGLLSLSHFLKTPLTLDFAKNSLILEDETSIITLREKNVSIPVEVEQDASGTRAYVVVALPSGDLASLLIDTRTDTLVLNEKYKEFLEIVDGRISGGDIALASEPRIREANPRVIFKPLSHDGNLGLHFFKKHRATFDLQRSQLLFAQ